MVPQGGTHCQTDSILSLWRRPGSPSWGYSLSQWKRTACREASIITWSHSLQIFSLMIVPDISYQISRGFGLHWWSSKRSSAPRKGKGVFRSKKTSRIQWNLADVGSHEKSWLLLRRRQRLRVEYQKGRVCTFIKMLARWVFSTQLWATHATGRGRLDGGLREGEGQFSCSIWT